MKTVLWWLGCGILFGMQLTACGWLPDKIDRTKNWSAQQLYSEAKSELAATNYKTAIDLFGKIQARYPFGRYAQQAQLETIYAYYKDDEPELALAAAERFIKTYPRHPYVDYAYYLKGLINFSRDSSTIGRLFPNDPNQTDTTTLRQSLNDFAELVRQFPDSKYADDARHRMIFLHNTLANHEIHVADYYLRRGAYVAAVNRAKYVLENYARTPAVSEALAIMTRAYLQLNMKDLAADSLRVLQLNYPDSPHLREVSPPLQPPAAGSPLPPPPSGGGGRGIGNAG